MGLIDLLLTPFYFLILLFGVFLYKSQNKKDYLVITYFTKAYLLRVFGGLSFGCIYFFYYGWGDTFNYHHDSMIISDALRSSPSAGLQLLFKVDITNAETYRYVSKLIWRTDPASHLVSSIAAIINLFTFDSFLSTTLFFAVIGFWGNWQLFRILCRLYPYLHKELAIGCLFLPSILFWNSGIMKDTLCTAALCFLFKSIVEVLVFNEKKTLNMLIIIVSTWTLYVLKIYILFCFIPSIAVYILSVTSERIKNGTLRLLIKPIFYSIAIIISYSAVQYIAQDNAKYDLDKIEATAQITANYIGKVSQESGGSFYTLGVIDFSLSSLPTLALKAFVVTFYRPFIWESKNIFMFFSAFESMYFIYLTCLFLKYFFSNKPSKQKKITPFALFCFLFALSFSFAVGVTSNNFGTLARYKSLMLPFFVCGVYTTIKKQRDATPSATM